MRKTRKAEYDPPFSYGLPSPFSLMVPVKRYTPPQGRLACPACDSEDVDEQARYCRSCETFLPYGCSLYEQPYRVMTSGMRRLAAGELQMRHQRG